MGATSSINRPQNLFKFKKESRKETQKQSKSTLATTSQVFTTVLIATPILQNSRKTFRKHLMKKGILPAAHTFKIHQFAMKVEPRITELLSDLAQQYDKKNNISIFLINYIASCVLCCCCCFYVFFNSKYFNQ